MIRPPIIRILHFSTVILAVLTLTTCDLLEEPQMPTWTNRVEFPLIRESVSLEDLENEDNIQSQLYGPDSARRSIFAYSDTTIMDSQAVGDQLAFGDITKSFAQSVDDVTVTGSNINQSSAFEAVGVAPISEEIESLLGTIELSDIPATITDPFLLNEIVPSVNDIPDGTTTDIPPGELVPVEKPFEFTDFSSAVFAGGSLDITINNSMVIALGAPINIQLQEVVGPDTVDIEDGLVTWDSPIASGTNSTRALDLTGMTLPGNILILVTGSSVGSEGNDILIDNAAKNSSFNIEISGSDLLVSSATAKVPAQNIDETGTIEMGESENKVQNAVIQTGSLAIEIDNTMEVASELVITITSLEDPGGTIFTTTVDIPAISTVNDVSDIAGYSLVMDVNQQEVIYSYTINTIDTEDNKVTLSETDQVTVTISLYGESQGEDIFFNLITGIIEPQNIEEAGDISITSDSKIMWADISVGTLEIAIDNRVNQPGFEGLPVITLNIPELVDADSNPLSGTLTLNPSPTENVLSFNLADYFLVFPDYVYPDTSAQMLTYTTLVATPEGELGKFSLEDSIIVDIVVSDMEFTSVRGHFSQDALVDENEIVLDEGTKLTKAVFETGDFNLTMTNRIGVVANVDFKINEFIHRDTRDTLQMSFELEATPEPQVQFLDLSEYNLEFAAAVPGVPQSINYTSIVSLPQEQEMTLTFGDSIIIDVDISGLSMESVTGIIEPETQVIKETAQSISMPEMVEDLEFEQVNIDIVFNSNFDIPIFLSLDLFGKDSLGNQLPGEINIVDHDLSTDGDTISIDATGLLNAHPDSIYSSGQVVIGGDGTAISTISSGNKMNPVMYINVPLSLIINDPPFIEADVTRLDTLFAEEEVVSVDEFIIFADVLNLFEFGATVVVLATDDSLNFDSTFIASGNAEIPDTLINMTLLPLENATPETEVGYQQITLGADKMDLFEDELFLKPEIQLLGREDGPSRFFTTDSLEVRIWGTTTYTIRGEEF